MAVPPRIGASNVLNQLKPSRAAVKKYRMIATQTSAWTARMPSTPSSGDEVPV
jgi:hypothetical protein